MANKRDSKKVTKSNKSLSKKPFYSRREVDKKIKPNADKPKSGSKRKATEECRVPDIKKKFTDDVVELNVGGKFITTLRSTLTKEPKSKLAGMFSKPEDIVKDKDGRCFIDCDSEVFLYIINFLRSGTLPRQEKVLEVYDLASHYQIQSLVVQLEPFFVLQYRQKISEIKKQMREHRDIGCEKMKSMLIDGIKRNDYCNPKEDITIYDTKKSGCCLYCPIRPAHVFLQSPCEYSDRMRTLVMYELCELGYAKNIDTKKINKSCNSCKKTFKGVEIVLVAH